MRNWNILLTCLLVQQLNAQSVQWEAHWGGGTDVGFAYAPLLAPDGFGNTYATGVFHGTLDMDGHVVVGPGSDVFLSKLDVTGTAQWARSFGEATAHWMISDQDRPLAIAYDPLLDEVVVVGAYNTRLIFDHDTLHPNADPEIDRLFIARFASDGECLWARYGTSGSENAEIYIDEASNVHIVANLGGTFQGSPSITLPGGGCHVVYAANGDLVSAERFLTGATIGGFCPLPNGKFAVTVNTQTNVQLFGVPLELSSGSGWRSAVVVADWGGNLDRVFQLSAAGNGVTATLCRSTADGRILYKGGFSGELYTPVDTIVGASSHSTKYVASLDPSGVMEWVRVFDSDQTVYFGQQLATDAAGNVYLQGSFRQSLAVGGVALTANTGNQGFLVKLDTAGICRAAWDFGKVGGAWGGVVAADDGLYFSCTYDSVFTFADRTITPQVVQGGYNSIFIAHLDSLSGFTGVQTLTGGGPQALHIYANPNNGICTVELPEGLRPTPDLMLSVYDNTGQLVQHAPLSFTENGLVLDIRAQAKGVYHVELANGRQRFTGTVVYE